MTSAYRSSCGINGDAGVEDIDGASKMWLKRAITSFGSQKFMFMDPMPRLMNYHFFSDVELVRSNLISLVERASFYVWKNAQLNRDEKYYQSSFAVRSHFISILNVFVPQQMLYSLHYS